MDKSISTNGSVMDALWDHILTKQYANCALRLWWDVPSVLTPQYVEVAYQGITLTMEHVKVVT